MIRPRTDLEEIDQQLESLGRPRGDLSAVVARYIGQPQGGGPQFDRLLATLTDAASQHAGPESAVHAASGSGDHDEFELLVDDEEMARIEDDQLEPVA
jgi:hypothetical protein